MLFRIPNWRQVGVAVVALALAAVVSPKGARAVDIVWLPTGSGDYNTGNNWADAGSTTPRGAVPSGLFEEEAVINNGGTATLSAIAADIPGGVVLGRTAADSGTLTINSGGVFTSLATISTSGNIVVGQAGRGTLNVNGTGSIDAPGLTVGGLATSQANFRDSAAVAIAGTSTIGRGLRITGPNVNFNSITGVTLQANSVLTHEITSAAGHSPIKSPGTVALGGALNLQFTGITPNTGTLWTLVDAATISGNFTNLGPGGEVPATGAPAGIGSAYMLRRTTGGTNGQLLQVGLERMLVLRVNRDTGELTIRNPQGAAVNALTGYTITSTTAQSLLAGYKGISGAPAGDTGWEKVPGNSTSGLAELKPSGAFNVSSNSTNVSLGAGFSRTAVGSKPLGTSGEDLQFTYTTFNGTVVRGQVEYTGTPFLNNLALIVNTTTGQATLKNDSSISLAVDGYSITSSTGALSGAGWNSLTDQAATYPNWQESPATGSLLGETNPVAPTTLTAGQSISLGTIGNFSSAAAQAGLSLKFILGSEFTQRIGSILFTTGAGLNGDFNTDGRVDGRDFLVWQRGGSPTPLSAADLATWRSNFGASSAGAAAAVPEPTTLALGLTLTLGCALRRRTRRNSDVEASRPSAIEAPRITSGQRIMNKSFFVLAALLLIGLNSATAAIPSLGINFAATDPDAATSTLAPTDIAGVLAARNWNNLEGATGTDATGLSYTNAAGAAASSGVTVTWSSPNTWRSTTGNNAFAEGPDRKLTAGYLDTGDTAALGISITINNIDAALRTPRYDVLVYMVSDSGDNRGGGYTINDGNGPIVRYGSTMASPSTFVEDPGTDVNNSMDGTFLRFPGLTGASITLTTNTTLTTPNGFRAPVNAVQIVTWSGDADGDGDADINDYNLIRTNMEKPSASRFTGGDLTGDGFVNLDDFRRWAFIAPPEVVASVGVPEPSALGLAAVSIVVSAWRRRRAAARGRRTDRSGSAFRPMLALALVGLLGTATASAQTPILGLNFAADDPDVATSSLNPTDVAGVVPSANWNNLTGATGTGVGGLVYNSGGSALPSAATVSWTSPNTWRSTTGNNAFPEGPDRKLTAGYLDTGDTAALGISITVTGIDAVIRAPAYDVYVYFVSDSGANRGGGYTLNDGSRSELKYGSTMSMPTTFREDPGTDADLSIDGNYLRFRGFVGSSFTLTTDTTLTTPNGVRAPVNAIQIVGAQTFAPGPGDVNEDGATNAADYNIIKTNFFQTTGMSRTTGDLNLDGRIDLSDFTIWRNNVPLSELASLGIPEPGTGVLAGAAWMGLAGMIRRFRRR